MSRPLILGFPWALTLEATPAEGDPAPFPEGCVLCAQVREKRGGPVLATLTTDAGALVREDDTTLRVEIPGAVSARWRMGPAVQSVLFDVVRMDTPTPQHCGFIVTVPVERAVTELP